eukprot:EG_transcript_58264
MPRAWGTTRMSLKMMAASKSKRSMGCSVAAHAHSGVRQRLKKSLSFMNSRYSGRYRPACRIAHTGMRGTGWPRAARSMASLRSGGKSAAVGSVIAVRAPCLCRSHPTVIGQ